jgi:hypothetical protein
MFGIMRGIIFSIKILQIFEKAKNAQIKKAT